MFGSTTLLEVQYGTGSAKMGESYSRLYRYRLVRHCTEDRQYSSIPAHSGAEKVWLVSISKTKKKTYAKYCFKYFESLPEKVKTAQIVKSKLRSKEITTAEKKERGESAPVLLTILTAWVIFWMFLTDLSRSPMSFRLAIPLCCWHCAVLSQ
jgi:hypothetical protein